jgi:hypothetical protein
MSTKPHYRLFSPGQLQDQENSHGMPASKSSRNIKPGPHVVEFPLWLLSGKLILDHIRKESDCHPAT